MNKQNYRRLTRRSILGIAFPLLLYIVGILIYGTLNDYQPKDRITLQPFQNNTRSIIQDSSLSFTIWNLGFGGLGREADFFYDDGHFFFSWGRNTRTPLEQVQKNMDGIVGVTDSLDSDFFLFQEVDRPSRRSHEIDQVDRLAGALSGHAGVYAENFLVPYVPIPLMEPWHAYGKVNSGLASYSRYQPKESVRLQLPGKFSWPKSVFSLDRCLSVQRFNVKGEKELVVVNVHNSAYDKTGELKFKQLNFIKDLLLREFDKGNYVIAGGDWNMCPPFFKFDGYMPGRSQGFTQINIPEQYFPPNWLWIYDATYPTNRKTRTHYVPGTTFVTLIDFFLVSPNVKVRKVETIHVDFKFSDHQPVRMEVELLSSPQGKE